LELVGVLGEGGFGSVLLAHYEGQDYAFKRLSKGFAVEQDVHLNVSAERDLLAMVKTPFIIKMHKSFRDDQWVYMLLEFCTGGNLLGVMENRRDILLKDRPRGSSAKFYTLCMSYALGYLHDRNIMYRDLKLENVLLDSIGYAKLCDLGFARFVHGKSNTQAGTPDYMAPEMIDPPHAHDKMVDWYSLGVLCCELFSGQAPYDNHGLEDPQMCLEAIRSQQDRGMPRGIFKKEVLAEDFVKKCLLVDPKKRLGSKEDGKEVREHGWFKDFDFQSFHGRTMASPYIAISKITEKRLHTTRTIKDHIKIDTDLFKFYDASMVPQDNPNWDACFDME
jgi:serine/threonine protein kinase